MDKSILWMMKNNTHVATFKKLRKMIRTVKKVTFLSLPTHLKMAIICLSTEKKTFKMK
jgi:hypothetical protein